MKKIYLILLLFFLLLPGSSVFAWWDLGHETASAIASVSLTPDAKNKIEETLRHKTNYPAPKSVLLTSDNMISASTWLDNVKEGKWDNDNEKKNCSEIHFIDVPFDVNDKVTDIGTAKVKVLEAKSTIHYNCYTAFESCIKSLTTDTSEAEKSAALKMLLHLAGDMHQPLHSSDPQVNGVATAGGNKIKFNKENMFEFPVFNGGQTKAINLHQVWDGLCGAYQNMPYPPKNLTKTEYKYISETASGIITAEGNTIIPFSEPDEWVAEAFIKAQQTTGKSQIDYYSKKFGWAKIRDKNQYLTEGGKMCRHQIYLAGNRLACILMAIYDPEKADVKYKEYVCRIASDSKIPTLQKYLGLKFR